MIQIKDERMMLTGLNLLTQKSCIYAANVSESDLRTKVSSSKDFVKYIFLNCAQKGLGNLYLQNLSALANNEGSAVCIVSAKVKYFSVNDCISIFTKG
jgi:ribosome-binding ATPase YchF (GTP1/OBG family)